MTTTKKAVAGLATTGIIGGVSAAATKKSPVEEELKIETEHQQPEEQKKEKTKVSEKKSKRHFKDKVTWSGNHQFFQNNLFNNTWALINNPTTRSSFLEKLTKNLSVFHKDGFLKWGSHSWDFHSKISETADGISSWCKSKYDLASEDEPDKKDLEVFGEFCMPK
ncbi:hypothetical protein [Candidatus Mycoplasma haematohominis]|uniref:hypothetical protein n=1 Tax=Candidatus Mycoplasma haematohominis TaxID=1494318 RepID=UPI001C0A69BD|nr:hypothetical protein [Candidatus Mycoplasma haemohominis]